MPDQVALENKKVNYYLRDGEDNNSNMVYLEKRPDRFTVILKKKEGDSISKDDQIKILKELAGDARIVNMSENTFQVILKPHNSIEEVDKLMTSIRKKGHGMIASHAYSQTGDEKTVFYLTDKVIVCLQPQVDAEKVNAVIEKLKSKYHLNSTRQYKLLKNTFLFELNSSSKENPIRIANKLEKEEAVEYAEPSLIRLLVNAFPTIANKNRPVLEHEQKRSQFPKQWYLDSVNIPGAWSQVTNDEQKNIVIAVIDKYFLTNHPAIKDNITSKQFDFVTPDTPFSEVLNDHGTSCAGLIVADSNSPKMSGIAPGCKFLPVRVAEVLQDDQLINAGEEIGELADVISCSWATEPSNFSISRSLKRLITNLANTGGPRGNGCVFCFSAGNFNVPVNEVVNNLHFTDSSGNANRISGPCINPFASHPKVISVAACTRNDKKADYSNYGNEISLCAPGSDLIPDPESIQADDASWIFTTAANNGEIHHGKYTDRFGGTSSAAAIVAGIAALILSVNSNLTAADVKLILEKSADKINFGSPELNGEIGEYVDTPDPERGAHSKWFGYGKINADRAIAMAIKLKP